MDAITLLKQDHADLRKLFKKFEKAEDDPAKSRTLIEQIVEELSVHTAIEEQVFYPAVREVVPDIEDMVLESLEEHQVAKWLLAELEGMDADHERFRAKATVMMENVTHHIDEEESDLFPQVRDVLKRKKLDELGDAMVEARKIAPTHPEPRSPDTPPGNVVSGEGQALLAKAKDAVAG